MQPAWAVKPRTVRDLLSRERRWVSGVEALDSNGDFTTANSKAATRFSVAGAMMRVYRNHDDLCRSCERLARVVSPYGLNERASNAGYALTVISDWEDHPERIFSDIRTALRHAKV